MICPIDRVAKPATAELHTHILTTDDVPSGGTILVRCVVSGACHSSQEGRSTKYFENFKRANGRSKQNQRRTCSMLFLSWTLSAHTTAEVWSCPGHSVQSCKSRQSGTGSTDDISNSEARPHSLTHFWWGKGQCSPQNKSPNAFHATKIVPARMTG